MKRFLHRALGSTTVLLALMFSGAQVQAQPSAYQLVNRDQAAMNRVRVQVAPGRATPISFSRSEETITYLLLGDPSRLVYSTDAALETLTSQNGFLACDSTPALSRGDYDTRDQLNRADS